MTLVLYEHPFASYCQKVLIALYELDVPFRAEIVEGDRTDLAAQCRRSSATSSGPMTPRIPTA